MHGASGRSWTCVCVCVCMGKNIVQTGPTLKNKACMDSHPYILSPASNFILKLSVPILV